MFKFVLRTSAYSWTGSRFVCFDLSIVRKFDEKGTNLVVTPEKIAARVPPQCQWASTLKNVGDGIMCGSTVTIPDLDNGENFEQYEVLCRTTRDSVILREFKSGVLLTVKSSNLPVIVAGPPSKEMKLKASQALFSLFDEKKVSQISIEQPRQSRAPLVFDAEEGSSVKDFQHPYMVLQYNDGSDAVAFPCTSAPHKLTMKLFVLDSRYGTANQLWDTDMPKPTAVDLSRLASFPAKALLTHFGKGDTFSKAIDKGKVLAAVVQSLAGHTMLDGLDSDDDDNVQDELPEYDDNDEAHFGLVIGHYEIDEKTMLPLPNAFE